MKNLFVFFLILVGSCQPVSKNQEVALENTLLGTWKRDEQDLYHKIYVQDEEHLGLDTHLDSILFYTYQLREDTLFIYGEHGQQISYNLVKKLTEDSLVLENLLDKKGPLRYYRLYKE